MEEINKEIELASRMGVACWFPMSARNERIVRLAGKEAILLNSRYFSALQFVLSVALKRGIIGPLKLSSVISETVDGDCIQALSRQL